MSNELENALATIMRPDFGRTLPKPAPVAPDAQSLVADYLARVYPSRGHGATDCGEYLDGSGTLSDGDHFLMWLGERGHVVVPL